ncbi:kelch-like protein 7 isoform 1-T2 [Glossina fuscipes fuscipes]
MHKKRRVSHTFYKMIFHCKDNVRLQLFFVEDIKGKSGMMQFEDIDIDTLKQIIDFIYSGKLTVNEKNVRNLLLASSLLQIDWITKKCFQFCKHRLNISNCFSLRKLAVAYDRTDLCDRCDDYIYRNFLEVIDTDEYGLLCFEEVKDLLSSNEIVTDTEVSVFDGVINWIKHCPSERLPLLLPLMNCVRLPIMSAKCLMTCVANEPYIKDNPECKDLLLDAMKYHLVPEKRYLMISERTQERKPSKMISHVILAGANCSEGRMYDKNFTNCVCMARMKQRRCQAGVTSWHNLLYVVGGKDQNNSLKTAECYNPLTNAWTNIPSMAAKHCNFGICSMYGLIYACGGHDGCSIHNYVECYDTLTSKWISCPAMKCSLDNTHASALDNCIYCMGTIGGLTNFERFDLREGIWCKMPSLLNYRKYSDMVSYGNCLFCMGGLSLDNRAQNTGERFDVRSNKWEHISSMPSARYGHSMVEIDSNIYVIGGDRNLTVEYYNIGLNEWVQLESASIKHSFGGAAVVNCFPLK